MKADLKKLWTLKSDLKVHIQAGPRLYAGGKGVVQAIATPTKPDEKPSVAWSAKITGTPHRMLAADDKLFVVTLEGSIYTFGEKEVSAPIAYTQPTLKSTKEDEWSKRAKAMLAASGAEEGYAVLLGVENERLIEELVCSRSSTSLQSMRMRRKWQSFASIF